ncbi:hypothetical protein [Changchengzhania lutea]|uniref:hypothetical protein n=1 Tax=Changchengzhania lutea TaxID=2049305 RepID=UPI00115ED7C6|nr:hypothetical protein [Changchengzhania lutea]
MKNKLTVTLRVFLIALGFSLTAVYPSHAQDRDIYELELTKDAKTAFKTNKKKGLKKNTKRADFYNLAFKIHPSVYIQNVKVIDQSKGKKVVKAIFQNTQSFRQLNKMHNHLKDVQFIEVRLTTPSDLNNVLNVSNLEVFNQLKYIIIKSPFSLDNEKVSKFIKTAPNSNIRVFYKNDDPS